MSSAKQRLPSIAIVGGGAAGLWMAMALLEQGWPASSITIFEPNEKQDNDRTWSFWASEQLLPSALELPHYNNFYLAAEGREVEVQSHSYTYYTLRSAAFYAYAKQVLGISAENADASNGVVWRQEAVTGFSESENFVTLHTGSGNTHTAAYVLDSRLPTIDFTNPAYNATLQHFGGWYLTSLSPCFNASQVRLMDFVPVDQGVAFFYVIPSNERAALVELAVFSREIWSHTRYDEAIAAYLQRTYPGSDFAVEEREYGVIPMTDEPLWRSATKRVWPIGTRAGWVQPSSGYAFTRIRRFAAQTAAALTKRRPRPWQPSVIAQTMNSVMLGHTIEHPELAGKTMLDLFERNGADATFRFLDERAGLRETLVIMWRSPKAAFTARALKEIASRLRGSK